MVRAEKITAVETMNEAFGKTPHVILTTFSGLKVGQDTQLRMKIRSVGGSYTVIKNRLARRAAEGTAVEHIADRLTGPCALARHESDPVVLAKTLSEFAKENPELKLLAGVIDGKSVLETEGVKQLASLPGLPELRAQLLSVFQTPATQLARLVGTPGTQLAQVLDARRKQLEEAS